ncbi:MAG: DUF697 domain-containing protein [Alphaproteobacteria bacterium]
MTGTPPFGPIIIETEAEGRIADTLPEVITAPPPPRAGLGRIGLAGVAILVFGLIAVDIAGFVVDQFQRGSLLGWATAAVVAVGCGTVAAWLLAEMRALSRLRRLPAVQARFAPAAVEGQPREVVLAALDAAAGALGAAPAVRAGVAAWRRQLQPHHGALQAVALFEQTALRPLDEQAQAATRRAVAQVFAVNVVSPSAALDTVAFVLRAIRLVREIATIYGHRPGVAATRHLVGRILLGAGLAGTANAVAHFGTRMLGHWMARFAGDAVASGLAAQRMLRIGRLATMVCRPLPFQAPEDATSISPTPSTPERIPGG